MRTQTVFVGLPTTAGMAVDDRKTL